MAGVQPTGFLAKIKTTKKDARFGTFRISGGKVEFESLQSGAFRSSVHSDLEENTQVGLGEFIWFRIGTCIPVRPNPVNYHCSIVTLLTRFTTKGLHPGSIIEINN